MWGQGFMRSQLCFMLMMQKYWSTWDAPNVSFSPLKWSCDILSGPGFLHQHGLLEQEPQPCQSCLYICITHGWLDQSLTGFCVGAPNIPSHVFVKKLGMFWAHSTNLGAKKTSECPLRKTKFVRYPEFLHYQWIECSTKDCSGFSSIHTPPCQ